jgi:hypothetical protein
MMLTNHPEIEVNKTTEYTESTEHRDCNSCHCEALHSAAEQSEAIPTASWTSQWDCFGLQGNASQRQAKPLFT